jgi:hypothetical protein
MNLHQPDPLLALGHPGHGSLDPASLLHYLLEPTHALVLAVAIAGSWLALRAVRRAKNRG